MSKSYTKSFYVLTSLFFTWGLITVLVDSLIPRLKDIFELSFFQAGLVQFAFFMAYGIISIPAGALLNKIGYKRGIILGLAVMGLGCLLFLPAASFRDFSLFMLGYFILASGMTVLQVAANPYVTVLGDERTAPSRLNLSQAFNSAGTTIAPILGSIFILSDNILSSAEIEALDHTAMNVYLSDEASAVQMPFLVLASGLILMALFVLRIKLPQLLSSSNKALSNYGKALKHKKLVLGVIGIFVYVGAEVGIGSYLVNYFFDMGLYSVVRESGVMMSIANALAWVFQFSIEGADEKALLGIFVTFYWGGAMIGRFVGSYLTKIYQPNRVLSVFALLAISMIVVSMLSDGLIAMWSILSVGLFNSIMFPTIFSIAIEDLGELKAQGSGLLCTAIAGGAFIPPLYGFFVDISGFKIAFAIILCCYVFILVYGRISTQLKVPRI
ncbi:MAG: sugar MFS transporter [Flavobacteriales bacterium]|nr:sugar MFS transporter [Flavobacteriales bacterium]